MNEKPNDGTVELYRLAANRHEIDRALSYLSDDFRLRFAGSDFSLSKTDLRQAMGWDKGAGGSVEWRLTSAGDASETYSGSERNEFLELIGISELRFETTFKLGQDGLIREQIYRSAPGQPSPDEEMRPAIEWASRHRPEILEDLYPEGRLIYTEEMARRWVALLRDWKAAEAK